MVSRLLRVSWRPATRRARFFSAAVLAAAGLAAVMLTWRHPGQLLIPTCPSLLATGLYCPGCGSMRASHHLLHGQWLEAWRHNPLLVATVPFLALWLLAHLDAVLRGRRWHGESAPALGWGLLGLILLYWLARNLPFAALAVLRPPS